jgi:hypothetical protein
MNIPLLQTRRALPTVLLAAALLLAPAAAARAAVIAEGTYTITAPERRAIPFRMVLTPTGARITPERGETLIFSFEKKSALVVDGASRTYFLLPLEFVPSLLAAGLGYDARGLGIAATGATKTLLGTSCAEVVVSGKGPRLLLRTWRSTDPGWSADYARLEAALGLPWAAAAPPAALVGLPLAGTLEIDGARPYRASWEITKLARDPAAHEAFAVPAGYRMDLERLMSVQSQKR